MPSRCIYPRLPPRRATHTDALPLPDAAGYRDDDDGVLADLEKKAEPELRLQAIEKWDAATSLREANGEPEPEGDGEGENAALELMEDGGFTAHVEVPDQDAIKQAILARRKQEGPTPTPRNRLPSIAHCQRVRHPPRCPPPRRLPARPPTAVVAVCCAGAPGEAGRQRRSHKDWRRRGRDRWPKAEAAAELVGIDMSW